MHHIERRPRHAFRQPDDAAERQVFRQRVMDFSKVFKTDPALADEFAVHMHDDVVVLGVNHAETAMCRKNLKHFPDIAEIDHASAAAWRNIRGEDLHRGIAGLDGFGELPGNVGRKIAFHHHVIGVVAIAGTAPILIASFDGILNADAVGPPREVDDRGGAAEQCGAADDGGRLGEPGRPVRYRYRPGAVHVRIDTARHHDLACGIDQPRPVGQSQTGRGHRRNLPIRDVDIVGADTVRRNDGISA
jgi:hypothetical protein